MTYTWPATSGGKEAVSPRSRRARSRGALNLRCACDFPMKIGGLWSAGPTEEGYEEPPMCPVGTRVGLFWAAFVIQLIGRYEAPVSPKKSNKAQEVRCHNVDFGIRNVRRLFLGS